MPGTKKAIHSPNVVSFDYHKNQGATSQTQYIGQSLLLIYIRLESKIPVMGILESKGVINRIKITSSLIDDYSKR